MIYINWRCKIGRCFQKVHNNDSKDETGCRGCEITFSFYILWSVFHDFVHKLEVAKYMFKTIQVHPETTPSLITPLSSLHNYSITQKTLRQISSSKEVTLT